MTALHEEPATVEQLAGAMNVLGLYTDRNAPDEHEDEARRVGGVDAYRMRLVNALLGAVQTEAILAGRPASPTTSVRRPTASSW